MPRLPNSSFFRLEAKNFFIIYPKCPLEKHVVLQFFKSLSSPPSYIHIAKEHHIDGSFHLHIFIQFPTKHQILDKTTWDITDGNTTYHPNFQEVSNARAVINYVNKVGDTLIEGELTKGVARNQHCRSNTRKQILESSSSAEEFLSKCRQLQPKAYVLQYATLKRIANNKWPRKPEVYTSRFNGFPHLTDTLHQWMMNNVCCLRQPINPKSLIVEGATRQGKTLWARSIGPHNYLAGSMDFSYYSDDARYNIVDNIGFKRCKYKKELLGGERNWVAGVKYGKPKKIKGGIPTIVLCNPDMSWDREFSPSFREWFNCHAIYEFLYSNLYE